MESKLQLKDLPREAPLRVVANGEVCEATFHHIDGMYSLCTINTDAPFTERAFHLQLWTPMILVDGRWEIDSE